MGIINVEAVLARVRDAEFAALDEVADYVAAQAKARAPIRKVFRESAGFRRRFRALTSPEQELAVRRVQRYAPYTDFEKRRTIAHIRNYARVELRRRGSANAPGTSRTLRLLGTERGGRFTARVDARKLRGGGFESATLHPLLSARGRYEVKSGRAIHREVVGGTTQVQIGGALKASIGNEGVTETNNGAQAIVAARIRYAKYVEFPTTHNAAQPFLLPALHGARTRLRQALAAELRSRLGGQ